MGVLKVRVKVFRIQDETRGREIEMVVDTGATDSVIPRRLAEELNIRASDRRTFTLADGRQVARELGWAGISHDGRSSPSLVILGEENDVPRLGAFALEGLGYEADPVAKTLPPATQFLL